MNQPRMLTGVRGQKGEIPIGHYPGRETDEGGAGPPLVAETGQGEILMKEEGDSMEMIA